MLVTAGLPTLSSTTLRVIAGSSSSVMVMVASLTVNPARVPPRVMLRLPSEFELSVGLMVRPVASPLAWPAGMVTLDGRPDAE